MDKHSNQQTRRNRVQRPAHRLPLAAAGSWIVQTIIVPLATSLLCYYIAAYLEHWIK